MACTGFRDDESGVSAYIVSVGLHPVDPDAVTRYVRDDERAERTVVVNLELQSGTTYFLSVRVRCVGVALGATPSLTASLTHNPHPPQLSAENQVGLRATSTAQVTIDTTAPAVGTIADGPGADVDWLDGDVRQYGLSANWEPWIDEETPVVQYEWTVAVSRLDADANEERALLFDWADVGTNTSAFVDGMDLHPRFRYVALVRGTNAAGLSSVSESDGVAIDTAIPCMALVYSGSKPGTDDRYQRGIDNTLYASWRAVVDPEHASPNVTLQCIQSGQGLHTWLSDDVPLLNATSIDIGSTREVDTNEANATTLANAQANGGVVVVDSATNSTYVTRPSAAAKAQQDVDTSSVTRVFKMQVRRLAPALNASTELKVQLSPHKVCTTWHRAAPPAP